MQSVQLSSFIALLILTSFSSDLASGYLLLHNEIPEYACGEILTADQGSIESPLFPDPYPPEVDCTWYIRARPGHRVRVTSQYFYLEYQPQCLWDYLVIKDGETEDINHDVAFCGTDDINFLSISNVVTLTFHTDLSGNDAGFRLLYETVATEEVLVPPSCNLTLREQGAVTSPYYPHNYPSDTVCVYRIEAPEDTLVSIKFSDFEVETLPCTFDKFEVFDGEPLEENLIGTHCGRMVPKSVTSSGSLMVLRLTSDASLESKGFNVTVRFVAADDVSRPAPTVSTTTTRSHVTPVTTAAVEEANTKVPRDNGTTGRHPAYACNVTVTEPESNVTSPDYPSKYPHNTYCVTRLRSEVISTFVIKFLTFNIEEGENCSFDSLSILQANKDADPDPHNIETSEALLWRKCGDDLDDPIVTWEGHGLDIVFRSDSSVAEGGFSAHVLITPVVEGGRCPDVCQNGGTCRETLLPDGSVDWRCACSAGFTGILCDVTIRRTCDDLECQNNGVCADMVDGAVCMCPSGYAGDLCEQSAADGERGSLFFTKMVTNMSLSLGSSAILECAVNDARAHVMWLFNDRILTNADASNGVEVYPGGVVVIPEVRDEHSGRYTCMAVTSDDLVERSAWLHLTEPCGLNVSKAPANVTVREGQAAMFECYVPDADVLLWRKDGDLVSSGPRKRVLVNHYLVVNPVMETDAGQYTCAARGANGCFSKSSAYLTVERTGHGRECGLARANPAPQTQEGRISSGREAPEKSAPWHVIIREQRKDTTFCGGSLISPDTVLTAAHCIVQFEETFGYPFHPRHIKIYMGTHHCEGNNGIYSGLKSYTLHEAFNNTYFNNDVALLKLDTPATFSDEVMPVCLERLEFVQEMLKPGRLGTITGCGDRHSQGIAPTYLHQVQIPYVPREICQERATAVNTTFSVGMFCAGYARSMRGDACSGDSGGPYVMQFSGRSIQVGIVSWGVGCDRENHYGYYTHVAHYYDWIMDHM